jgi:MFS family permease
LGPFLGGVITEHFSWRWIFWINVPFGFLTFILAFKFLPSMPARPIHKLDKSGFILFGSGLATLTLGLSLLSESDIQQKISLFMLIIAFILLGLYAWCSYQKTHPIVKIDLLKTRTFRVAVMANLFSRLSFGGVPFLLPLFLQISLGFSPQLSGMLLVPIAIGVLIVKPLSLYILRFMGYKNLLIFNTILVGLSLLSFIFINAASSIYFIGSLTFSYGFLIALQYTGMNSLAYANLLPEDISAATSIMSAIQQLAQSFGVAVAALLLRYFSSGFSSHIPLTTQTFHQTFLFLGFFTFISLLVFLPMKKDDGLELIAL